MRISDWSSDVCSSDLLAASRLKPAFAIPIDWPAPTTGATGRSTSRLPAAMPTINTAAHNAKSKPKAVLRKRPAPAAAGTASKAPSIAAPHNANAAQPSILIQPGSMELTIHQAVANSKMPNKRFTPFIQAPALGSKKPDVAPTASNNKPSPQAIANRAVPPNIKSPVCEMNSKTPANGAATPGPTNSAEDRKSTRLNSSH